MIFALGYNFLSDGDSLNPSPTVPNRYTDTTLQNGIFDHWNVTQDISSNYSPDIPTEWDLNTLLDANFNGNLDAGNLNVEDVIDKIKIKRKKINEFEWITIAVIDVTGDTSLDFAIEDNLTQSGVEYEYAFVPCKGNDEGSYFTKTVASKFNGVYICDFDTIYKFYAGVSYGSAEQVQKIGVFEPFGRKYPVVVSNGVLNYHKGSVSGTILPPNYLNPNSVEEGKLDRLAMVEERKNLLDFLTNKKAKILKDWNGNMWLMIVTNSPTTAYNDKSGMGVANVNIEYTEIGDAFNSQDLYSSGLLTEGQ